jgi:hypothetical protein
LKQLSENRPICSASRVPDPRTFSWNRKFADEDDRDHHEPSPRHGRQGADEDDHPEPRTGLQTTGTRKTSTCSLHTYSMLNFTCTSQLDETTTIDLSPPLSAFLLNLSTTQVHELHRLYHVQKQLMQVRQAHAPAPATRAPAVLDDAKPRRPQLDIWCSETARNPPQQQFISFNTATAPAPAAPAENCNLELTLATGPSSSGSCDAGRWQGKRLKASPNSGSAATAVSSTSTDSELARFGDIDVVATPVARFHGEVTRRMDEVAQGPWMYRCLSLKTA